MTEWLAFLTAQPDSQKPWKIPWRKTIATQVENHENPLKNNWTIIEKHWHIIEQKQSENHGFPRFDGKNVEKAWFHHGFR